MLEGDFTLLPLPIQIMSIDLDFDLTPKATIDAITADMLIAPDRRTDASKGDVAVPPMRDFLQAVESSVSPAELGFLDKLLLTTSPEAILPSDDPDLTTSVEFTEGEDPPPDDEIVVTGKRPKNPVGDPEPDVPDIGGGSGTDRPGGGGVGTGGGQPVPTEEPFPPCVEAPPDDVDWRSLKESVLGAAEAIGDLSPGWEWGAIFYLLDGVLHSTEPFTSRSPDFIDWNLGITSIPDGAVIVATIHSHPYEELGISSQVPSYQRYGSTEGGTDWLAYESFLQFNTRNITTDPNLLMFIYSTGHDSTHVYDKTDKNTDRPQCAIRR